MVNLKHDDYIPCLNQRKRMIGKSKTSSKSISILLLVLISITFQGCFLTKIITVPLRVGAGVISIVPLVGNTAHDSVDEVAEIIDEVPI